MAIDINRINTFLSENIFRSKVAKVIRSAGFQITSVNTTSNSRVWSAYVKPNQPLKKLLSLDKELLIWVSEFDEYQVRSSSGAIDLVSKEERLSNKFIIVITGDENTDRLASSSEYPVIVGFSFKEISEFDSSNAKNFVRVLQSRLYFKDMYWMSNPIQSSRDFYGRQNLLSDITTSLVTSQFHVGLFGLRKMGKTSFLYRLLEQLQKGSLSYVCYLDMQLIDAVNPSPEYFLWSLGNSLYGSMGRQKVNGLNLLGKYDLFYSIEDKKSIFELFVSDVTKLFNSTKRVFVVALDEIELMAPESVLKGGKWTSDGFVKIWRILRGLDQQNPGKISYFITGTNPKLVEVSQIGSADNPIYSYFRKEYLQPLRQADSRHLLSSIGILMGLKWSDDALDLVHKRVGGHPLLLRAYASVIHNEKLPREIEVDVNSSDVTSSAENFMRRVSPQLSQMLDVISDYYPDETVLLELLADGHIGEFRRYAVNFPNEVAHLQGYGLIEFTDSKADIAIEPLQTWLQRKKTAMKNINSGENDVFIGREIEDYIIISSIGNPGGFSNVYKAVSKKNNESVAIKILRNGLLSNLQREVDVLSEFEYPGIVKLINSGETLDGIVYLIMEYLEGETLRSYCQRSRRLTPDQIRQNTISLLDTLAYIHPNMEKILHLRTKHELSVSEFTELERARHGRIHRDIKPENVIMSSRGPVLIDFNISVVASQPVVTQSHTPGYLPPDMPPGQWTVDVDLYQLGLTMAQVATGIEYMFDLRYSTSNVEDIRKQLYVDLPYKTANVIDKLFDSEIKNRFNSSQEAKKRII